MAVASSLLLRLKICLSVAIAVQPVLGKEWSVGLGLRGKEMEKRKRHCRALWITIFEIMHQLFSWRQLFTP